MSNNETVKINSTIMWAFLDKKDTSFNPEETAKYQVDLCFLSFIFIQDFNNFFSSLLTIYNISSRLPNLPFSHQLAISIQGPVLLLDYDPAASANRFRHHFMNLAHQDVAHRHNAVHGHVVLAIHTGSNDLTPTDPLCALLWALYKAYSVIGLAGGNPLALMTSFTNPCKDATQLSLRTQPGHDDPVEDLALTDFGGLRGSSVIHAAYYAIGGDEFYTMCGRNMPTILTTTKFHRDYLVFSVVRLAAGPLRQQFVALMWKKQFSLFHCFSGVHKNNPSLNIKIPVTSFNPDSKQGTENLDRMHGAPTLLTAEHYASATCFYITQEFTDILNSGAGLENDNKDALAARPSPAELDETDTPIIPACPMDFGDLALVFPFHPPTPEEAAIINAERLDNAHLDSATYTPVWYPPTNILPRSYPGADLSPAEQARRARTKVIKQQRTQSKGAHPPATTGKRNEREDDDDDDKSDSERSSEGGESDQDHQDDQPPGGQPSTTGTHQGPPPGIQTLVNRLSNPNPAAGISAHALAAFAGLANRPNAIKTFHNNALLPWDVRATTNYGTALNALVHLVPYSEFRIGDALITWTPTTQENGYVDPDYSGTTPHTYNSDCVIFGWRRGRQDQGSTVWYLAFSSNPIPSNNFPTRLLITPSHMTRRLTRLSVAGAQLIKGQLKDKQFFCVAPRSNSNPDQPWQGNDDKEPGGNPPDKQSKSKSTSNLPQSKKSKRPESHFAAPVDQRSHFAPPIETIDDDDGPDDQPKVPNQNRTSPQRNSMPNLLRLGTF